MAQAPPASLEPNLWPFAEARKLAERVRGYGPAGPVIFESGFGPSGLPHLGTMSEVLRPSYVRHALRLLGNPQPDRFIVFIDDMDGLRKVPESIPNRERTASYLGQPVSRIPDPYGDCHASFAAHMIGLLGRFLEPVEADYELVRSSAMYGGGDFDAALRLILEKHEEITALITPTLRPENRRGWSPIMPLCPQCDQVNSTVVTAYHPDRATVEFSCERQVGVVAGCGWHGEQTVLGGHAKAQWKVDWALRWFVFKVDYELYGKDLIDSARLSGQIVRLLGGRPPLGFPFEMYLDEDGHKVSKSVGRGVGVEQWSSYAPIEVLKYFLILNPRRARKLFLEAIPQYVDEYLDELRAWSTADEAARRNSPLVFVLQQSSARRFNSTITFSMIVNLASALAVDEPQILLNYVLQYDPGLSGGDEDTQQLLRTLLNCARSYYSGIAVYNRKDFTPTEEERNQLRDLRDFLDGIITNPGLEASAESEAIETAIYEIGRKYYPDKPGKIFRPIYLLLLGQERGPRLGSFIRLAGIYRVSKIINEKLSLRGS